MILPASEADVIDVVRGARADRTPLAIRGGGTRAGLGRPVPDATPLSTSALTGITLYEPAELVIAARAGTPLAEVEAALAEKGQILPFEPPDARRLYASDGEPTVGGVAAANGAGPRRVQVGAARDLLIGVRLVTGRGEIVKSGGRVMKNVTGLDLVKLACGSYGTLAVLTEVTFKVLPRAERAGTIVIDDLDDARAIAALSDALASPFEVSAAAHLPAGIDGPRAATLIRLENVAASVDSRLTALAARLASFGTARRLNDDEAEALWRNIRDAAFLAAPADDVIWRISTAASRASRLVEQVAAIGGRHFYDWGGGLVWLAVPSTPDGGASMIRKTVEAVGGHATLVRGSATLRAAVPVFQPLSAPLMTLTERLKTSFDPDRVLNPGLMYESV